MKCCGIKANFSELYPLFSIHTLAVQAYVLQLPAANGIVIPMLPPYPHLPSSPGFSQLDAAVLNVKDFFSPTTTIIKSLHISPLQAKRDVDRIACMFVFKAEHCPVLL